MNEHELTPNSGAPGTPVNPEVTYEPRDLSARAIVSFLIGLAVAVVLIQVVMWGVYKYMAGSEFQPRAVARPIGTSNQQLQAVGGDPARTFPSPRLQPDPVADLNKFRVSEEEWLNSYGWVDPGAGKVHIPIERAIDLVAASGLPTRPNAPAIPMNGAVGAADGINVLPGAGKAEGAAP